MAKPPCSTISRLLIFTILLSCTFCICAAVPVEIRLEGVNDAQQKNILNQLTIHLQKDHPLASEEFIRAAHLKAPAEITRALEPFGYYQAAVTPSLNKTDNGFIAIYKINTGKAVSVAAVNIQLAGPGATEPLLQSAVRAFPLQKNDQLNHAQYERGKTSLQQTATELGYLDAVFAQHVIQVNRETYSADIELHLNTGERYFFGEIRYDQDILKDDILLKNNPVKQGNPYSVEDLLTLQESLYSAGYFSRADVIPDIQGAENLSVPIDIVLEPRKRNHYSAGVGYGTDTGGRISAGWQNRRINRRGHRFGVDLLYTEINNSQTARYTIPLELYEQDHISITANRFHEFLPDYDELTRSLSLGRTWVGDELQTTIAATYAKEDYTVGETKDRVNYLEPSINWTYVDADDRIYTTHGGRYSLRISGAHENLLSDLSFIQAEAKAKWIHQFDNRSRFITRGALGHTWIDELVSLPSSLRFFAGGDSSIRGYDYKDIGEVDSSGAVIGGKHLIEASIEYEFPFSENWYAAIFYDAGNAFDEYASMTPLKQGAGIGLHWKTPIGLIRFDIAWPQDDPDAERRIHVIIGPDL